MPSGSFECLLPHAQTSLLLICDHASNHVPGALAGLGLSQGELGRHIAWDIGAGDVTRKLSALLGATAVLGTVSRLVIDLNRDPKDPAAMPERSDGTDIPGNRALTKQEALRRVRTYFDPYHLEIERQLSRLGDVPLLSIHSFTPEMNGQPRPWHVGILWNQDGRLALPLIEALRTEGDLTVGDNQPYSGRELAYSMNRHAGGRGLLHAGIEIRQDLIDTSEKAHAWAGRLARIARKLLPL